MLGYANRPTNLWSENRGTKQINVISTGLILFLALLISRWNFIVERIFAQQPRRSERKKNAQTDRQTQRQDSALSNSLQTDNEITSACNVGNFLKEKKERKKEIAPNCRVFCPLHLNEIKCIDEKNNVILAAHLEVQMSSSSTSFRQKKSFLSPLFFLFPGQLTRTRNDGSRIS